MAAPYQIIIGCWVIFLVYWIISARGTKPVAERSSSLATFCYRAPLVLGGLLFGVRRLPPPLNMALTPDTAVLRDAGAVVCVLGLCLMIWARRILAGNWSSDVTFKQGHELIQRGPYRFVRHPIYSGLLLLFLGAVIAQGQLHRWLGLAIVFAGLWIKLHQEERLMLQHFPNEYPGYMKRVKALIPGVV